MDAGESEYRPSLRLTRGPFLPNLTRLPFGARRIRACPHRLQAFGGFAPSSGNSVTVRKPSATGRRRRSGRILSNRSAGFIPPVNELFPATYQPVASFTPPCRCRNQATIQATLQHTWRMPGHCGRAFQDRVSAPDFYREPCRQVWPPRHQARWCIM